MVDRRGYFNPRRPKGAYEWLLAKVLRRNRHLTWSIHDALQKAKYGSALGLFLAGVFIERWLHLSIRDLFMASLSAVAAHFWWGNRK